jgi:hypothetical protein
MIENFDLYTSRAVSLLRSVKPDFCEMIQQLTNEWNEKAGHVNCEFSTGYDYLHEKCVFLHSIAPKKGCWRLHFCQTCFGYHPEAPYHAQIINDN